MEHFQPKFLLVALAMLLLSGCGSSNEDFASQDPSNYAVSTNTFNVAEAWANLVKTGFSKSLEIYGSDNVCTGTAHFFQTSAKVVDLNDPFFTYLSQFQINQNITSCSNGLAPFSINSFQYNYFNNDLLNTYTSITQNFFGEWTNTEHHAVFPAAAKVGDAGWIGFMYYQGGLVGDEFWSYKLEADTATTAVLVVNIKTLDPNGNDYSYEIYRYLLKPNNTLSLRSFTTWSASNNLTITAR
jgi:uncharacterized protein YceK